MNIYKGFRTVETNSRLNIAKSNDELDRGGAALSSRFDQPTYLSFRLGFGVAGDYSFNNAGNVNQVLNYDIMPHPLFGKRGEDNVIKDRTTYSAIDYLLDANEFTRANMLEEFIQKFNQIQIIYPWYFQSVEGVGELLKIDPTKGMRVTSDKRINVTVLEAIDLRMSYLMNLYRKIVWDDTYQRWVLPDMMRYFSMNIYIAEYRTFHTPNPYTGYGYALNPAANTAASPTELHLDILDNILPTWVIRCEMCEFDIQSVEMDYLSNLGVADVPGEAGVKFGIKVGKVYEEQVYPTFKNGYLIDKALNGYNRSKSEEIEEPGDPEFGLEPMMGPFDSTQSNQNNNKVLYNPESRLNIAQSHPTAPSDQSHISGAAFQTFTNEFTTFGIPKGGPGKDGKFFTKDDKEVVPDDPNTWVSNTVDWGKAFAKSKLDTVIDKAKTMEIPGLGLSFNEAEAAIQSKNFITAFGMIRKGVDEVLRGFIKPSELLEGGIQTTTTDGVFKSYLEEISKSEATNESEIALIEAANNALNDDGTWQVIKDLSRATDKVGPGEVNSPNPIAQGKLYKDAVDEATQLDNSWATDLVGKGEANVTKIITKEAIFDVAAGKVFEGKVSSESLTTSESNINNTIPDGYEQPETGGAATNSNESLAQGPDGQDVTAFKNIEDGYDQGQGSTATSQQTSLGEGPSGPDSNINKSVEDGYDQVNPSAQIGKTISVSNIFEGIPSSKATTNKLE